MFAVSSYRIVKSKGLLNYEFSYFLKKLCDFKSYNVKKMRIILKNYHILTGMILYDSTSLYIFLALHFPFYS